METLTSVAEKDGPEPVLASDVVAFVFRNVKLARLKLLEVKEFLEFP